MLVAAGGLLPELLPAPRRYKQREDLIKPGPASPHLEQEGPASSGQPGGGGPLLNLLAG